MTEAEWDAAQNPKPMLDSLPPATSRRKLRLFACACARRVWEGVEDERDREAVAVAERFADGLATPRELAAARGATALVGNRLARSSPTAEGMCELAGRAAAATALGALPAAVNGAGLAARARAWGIGLHAQPDRESSAQAALLRDIFGNPFRPVAVDRAWLGWQEGTIPRLAQAAYDERHLPSGHLDAARLAVLADALEEGGCNDPLILGHLRSGAEHVRGCFVVDAILGKT
jgi:hypothetical protein